MKFFNKMLEYMSQNPPYQMFCYVLDQFEISENINRSNVCRFKIK